MSDASITFTDHDDSMFLSFYVRNIEDNQRQLGGNSNPGGVIATAYEQPRTYGVRIGGKF